MYNRYTPRQDGGFRHDRVPEPARPRQNTPPPKPSPQPEMPQDCPPEAPSQTCARPEPRPLQPHSATSFLSGLLPRNMDTGDLLMLLILLLLITDGSEEAPNPLLTIALFFLME